MIGILCSDHMEKSYADELNLIAKKVGIIKVDSIIVFTILNIDFETNTVTGSLISGEGISEVQVAIPSVIFNFSLQRDMKSIKVRKMLEDLKGITLINEVNRYDQWMIMDMLYSSKEAQKYLLPYHVYSKADRNYKPEDEQSYIIMPARGASISRVIHAIPEESTDRIGGTQYFKKGQVCDYIDASLCQSHWIFIEVPELMNVSSHPIIVRSYVQRTSRSKWKTLGRNVIPEFEITDTKLIKEINKASIVIVEYINRFLPAIGFNFIDFILSDDGYPYFLHFSGFEEGFFEQERNEDFYKRFYQNLLSLAGEYNRMHKED